MGQKVNPHGFRVGPSLSKDWSSIVYADKDYKKVLIEDLKIREYVNKNKICLQAQVSRLLIERSANKLTIHLHVRKPGLVIGKAGADIDLIKKDIQKICLVEVFINIHEVKRPNVDAQIIAQGIKAQLEKRGSFKKAMKSSIQSCTKHGAEGIKITCSGRLGGAEIARTESYKEGKIPLHTLSADIDYATSEALTIYGIIGIKVWVYKGNSKDLSKDGSKDNRKYNETFKNNI